MQEPCDRDAVFRATPMALLRLDAELRILAANASALEVLARHPALRPMAGHLRLRRVGEHQQLRAAARELPPDDGKAAVMLRSRQGGPVLMIVLRALAGGEVLATLAELAGAPAPDPEALAELFGLAVREARVLALIATGATPGEAAKRLALQIGTVRGYLKSGMRKLDVRSQAQVASRVLRALQAWQP